jgi:DNA-binding MarR family transcriptional regulator
MEADICYNLAMRQSSRLITQFYEERLKTAGLKSGQFSILRAVHFTKQTTNKELQRILILGQTTLSRNLKPLLRDGFLELNVDPNDQRIKLISLTLKGKKLYQKALPLWQVAQLDIRKKFDQKELSQILTLSDSFVKELSLS